MRLSFLLFLEAQAGGILPQESKLDFRKRIKSDAGMVRKEPYGGWRSFSRASNRKDSQALCEIRGTEQSEQCCDNINIECLGCNPSLLQIGIPCDQQTSESEQELKRDCFCDSSCIIFDDCCKDHIQICDHLYDPTQPPTTTPKTTTTSTTTTTTTTTTTKTTTTTTTTSTTSTTTSTTTTTTTSTSTTTTTSTTTSTTTTTTVPATTTTKAKSGESWIFRRLFKNFQGHLEDRWMEEFKLPNMQRKYNKAHTYFLNAEHNCRLDLAPFPGDANKGEVTTYDHFFNFIEDENNDYGDRMRKLNVAFDTYLEEYYYKRETTSEIQGCDGKHKNGNLKKGKQYRLRRLTRKIEKPIRKILRRKKQLEKRKNQRD